VASSTDLRLGALAPGIVSVIRGLGAGGDEKESYSKLAPFTKRHVLAGRINVHGFASRTWTFFCLLRTPRKGAAISPGESEPVATW